MKRNVISTGMTVFFLLLMNYRFTGNLPHEILGAILFLFVLWHNKLNLRWYVTFFKGKQNFIEHVFGWGPSSSVVKFFLDYLALLGCYTGITYYAASLLSKEQS